MGKIVSYYLEWFNPSTKKWEITSHYEARSLLKDALNIYKKRKAFVPSNVKTRLVKKVGWNNVKVYRESR